MNYDNVKFGLDGQQRIKEGAKLAINAVAQTYGPNGANVLIRNRGLLKSTKDGASVIQVVNDPDKFVQMGIDVIKEASVKTASTVGDGSTTVAILAGAIIDNYSDEPDSISASRKLKELGEETVRVLEKKKKKITTKKEIQNVATLSANNDPVIGQVIAEAFSKVGKDGIVSFKESEDVKDRVEYSNGFRIESGFDSPYFINTSKNECVLENVVVYLSATKLEESKEIVDLAGKVYTEGKSLLLIAPEFDSGLTMFLVKNLYNSDGTPRLKACTVTSPNFGVLRDIMMEDLRILFGDSRTCEKVTITKETATFTGYTPDQEVLNKRVENIRDIIRDNEVPEQELNFHKKRLANFTAGMATIFVGGYSKVEMKERYDRFEDAIMATQCAMDGGVLPGGGTALSEVSESFADEKFKKVLNTPINLLSTDIKTPEQALNKNVIEPFLVVKATVENAIAVASIILTTNCVIFNE